MGLNGKIPPEVKVCAVGKTYGQREENKSPVLY